MTTSAISRLVRSVGFAQEELFLLVAEGEDAARALHGLLKDDEVEKVFGEFVVSATPPQ